MSEPISWIAFAFAALVAVERIANRIKKSKCSCCGNSAEIVTELESPKKKEDSKL